MKTQKLYTLIFIRSNNNVLLGLKTRGFGKGKWNGFGGKVEANETVFEGAARELKEESNLEASLKPVGIVTYLEERKHNHEEIVHIFTANDYKGPIVESDEMSPIKWFDICQLPYEKMWPDAPSWVPLIFENKLFKVDVTYGCRETITNINKNILTQQEFVTKFA